MISCNLKGGLGNQLFQIFATIAYALDHKENFIFKYTENSPSVISPRPVYWHTFLKAIIHFTTKNVNLDKGATIVKERGFEYEILPHPDTPAEKVILLDGYFQSYKYFEKHISTILRLIKFEERKRECKEKYGFKVNDYISMHFRIGDYKQLGNFYPIMDMEYYKKALSHILQNRTYLEKVLYFCEEEDNATVSEMIHQLQTEFPRRRFEKAPSDMTDWEQLIMMSCCDSNIIANSSFSLFGAYFNQNPAKIVCYPNRWFCGSGENINVGDLFPTYRDWKKIV